VKVIGEGLERSDRFLVAIRADSAKWPSRWPSSRRSRLSLASTSPSSLRSTRTAFWRSPDCSYGGPGLREAARHRPPAGLSGRDVQAARRRNPLAGRDGAGAAGPRRLRIHAQRRGQPVHDVRSARRLARRQGHRPSNRCRLRARSERPV
jgi:hypothetical protein